MVKHLVKHLPVFEPICATLRFPFISPFSQNFHKYRTFALFQLFLLWSWRELNVKTGTVVFKEVSDVLLTYIN